MEALDNEFDIDQFREKVRLIGGEVHIVDITDRQADQILNLAMKKGIDARKDSLSDFEAQRMNMFRRTTVYLGHAAGSERKLFE